MCRNLAYCRLVLTQVFTAAVPFSNRSDAQVICAIMQRRRPARPTHPTFTDNLWMLMQRCWNHDPRLRPDVSEALRVLLTPSVSRSLRRSYIHSLDSFTVHSEDPAWKQLISHTLTTRERISLITTIFSDHNQVEMVGNLFGDDAQNLINAIDEVCACTLSYLRDRSVDSRPTFYTLSIRCWTASNHRSTGSACTFYPLFVVA